MALAPSDVAADGFRLTFDGFGRHLKTGEQFDPPAAVIERRVGTNQRQHAAHSGGQVRLLDIQRGIGGALTFVAMRTQIPGAQKLHLAQRGQHMPRTHLAITGLLATRAGYFPFFDSGRLVSQQLAQSARPGLMHGGTHRHFDSFQIHTARLAATLENDTQ